MESSAEKQEMIACFVKMLGESTDRAQQFLQASNWHLEEAIQLFNAHKHGHGTLFSSFTSPLERRSVPSLSTTQNPLTSSDHVRPRLSVKRKSTTDPDPLDNGFMERPYKRYREVYEIPIAESSQCQFLPPLPVEPQDEKGLNICRVCLRFADGQRVQRRFLLTDPIQLLWSFCCSQVKEAADGRPFRLAYIVPGASQILDYFHSNLSFGDVGISNSLISMIWE